MLNQQNYEEFFSTMVERQNIWINRTLLGKPFPWSDNPILSNHKFTNVYRELDRNSQCEVKNVILDENLYLDRHFIFWSIMFFRMFNSIEFFQFLDEQEDFKWKDFYHASRDTKDFSDKMYSLCQIARLKNINPFTNAYLTNTAEYPGKTRDWAVCYGRIPSLVETTKKVAELSLKYENTFWLERCLLPEDFVKIIQSTKGFAGFMSHEIYISFCYIAKYTKHKIFPFTEDDYTNVGPGAYAGIKMIFGEDIKFSQAKKYIYQLLEDCKNNSYLLKGMQFVKFNRHIGQYELCDFNLTLHQIEMWLCEFQKYVKMRDGFGKQRSKFIPRTDGK